MPRERAGRNVVAAGLDSRAADLEYKNVVLASIGFPVANISEPAFAARLLGTRGKCRIAFADPRALICFVMEATLAKVLSATIMTSVASVASTGFSLSRRSTDPLGDFVVTPLVLIAGQAPYRDRFRTGLAAAPEAIAVFALVAIVTSLTFSQSSYPILFMPMLAVLIAAFRLGSLVAAGSVLIVTIVLSIAIPVRTGW